MPYTRDGWTFREQAEASGRFPHSIRTTKTAETEIAVPREPSYMLSVAHGSSNVQLSTKTPTRGPKDPNGFCLGKVSVDVKGITWLKIPHRS